MDAAELAGKMMRGDILKVHDLMQTGYQYQLTAPMGKEFDIGFRPHYTPKEMLEMGIFEGKYCNDCQKELPEDWFKNTKISDIADPGLNSFKIKSRQSLAIWLEKGWIIRPDSRGWFQWYWRYFLGRRLPKIDEIQIKRWKASPDMPDKSVPTACRAISIVVRQRQALLQWSYDPFI